MRKGGEEHRYHSRMQGRESEMKRGERGRGEGGEGKGKDLSTWLNITHQSSTHSGSMLVTKPLDLYSVP